jgi:hypothetical protein
MPGFSKHDMIYCSIMLRTPRSVIVVSYRNNKGTNLGQLLADAASIDWSFMYALDDLDAEV